MPGERVGYAPRKGQTPPTPSVESMPSRVSLPSGGVQGGMAPSGGYSPQAMQAAQLVRSLRGRVAGQPLQQAPLQAPGQPPQQGAKGQQMPSPSYGQMRFPTISRPVSGSSLAQQIDAQLKSMKAAQEAAMRAQVDYEQRLREQQNVSAGGGGAGAGSSAGEGGGIGAGGPGAQGDGF